MSIKLGDKGRDKVTGYTGIVTSITEWLNGCKRVSLQSQELQAGKPVDSLFVDIEQVEYVDEGLNKPLETYSSQATKAPGGPRPDPQRSKDPTL